MMESNPQLRGQILERLLDAFPQIRAAQVLPPVMWILGEYSNSKQGILQAYNVLKESVGKLPITKTVEEEENGDKQPEAQINVGVARPAVLADGTYATQTAVQEQNYNKELTPTSDYSYLPNIRAIIFGGDYYVPSILAATLTKLIVKYRALKDVKKDTLNKLTAEVMLILVSILRAGKAQEKGQLIDSDSYNRITQCIVMLAQPTPELEEIFLNETRKAFTDYLKDKQLETFKSEQESQKQDITQCDDTIDFQQLKANKGLSQLEMEDEVATEIAQATGFSQGQENGNIKQQKIVQLTGLSDTIFAEAVITSHQYDIVMDIMVTNQTAVTLQNVAIELQTVGDLRLVEKPQTQALLPKETKNLKANIKVASTETGVVFGNITYDSTGHSDRQVVVMNNIHIDIMDYINPAECSDNQFKYMWMDFEWENKVKVDTNIEDLQQYLKHVASATNMKCLTSQSQMQGEGAFLTANLYARSVFGEDALINLSLEKQKDGRLAGYIRIRSKTQGIALSLGEQITLKQKVLN